MDLTPAETLLTEAGQGWQEHQPEVVDADCPSCDTGYCRPHHVVSCAECGDDWPCYTIRAYQAGREDAAREAAEKARRIGEVVRGSMRLAGPHECGTRVRPKNPGCPSFVCNDQHGHPGPHRRRDEVADQGDQPRTVEQGVGDNPEEQR